MAPEELIPSMETDAFEPADVDWPNADESMLLHAAADGIPEAIAEVERRWLRTDERGPMQR